MNPYQIWKNSVMGVGLDVDRMYGNQCADVMLSYGQACFPGVHWSVLFPPLAPPAHIKDEFERVNRQYFDVVTNNVNDPHQLPPQGAIAFFDAAPYPGYTSTYENPDGHVGVVDGATPQFLLLVQQDGSESNAKVQLKQRNWNYTHCKGWAIPKLKVQPTPVPSTGDGRIGRTLYLHGVPTWRVYPVGAEPVYKNTRGFLLPGQFREGPAGQPGLQYRIEGVSRYANTVTIRTQAFGLVDIFVDQDGEIL